MPSSGQITIMNAGLINGIDYRNCSMIMTATLNAITIRFQGEPQLFIRGMLGDFVYGGNNTAFASLDAFIAYWNANYAFLKTSSI